MNKIKAFLAALVATAAMFFGATPANATIQEGGTPWAAGIDQQASTRINGKFQVPQVSTACGTNSAVVIWVGLGNSPVMTHLGISVTPNGVSAWWETYANGVYDTESVPFTFHPGNYVNLSMAFLNNETEVEFKWWDTTTGAIYYKTLTNAYQFWPHGSGSQAEWVIEQYANTPIAYFGTLKFIDAWYGMPTTSMPASPLDINMYLTDPNANKVITVSEVSGSPGDLIFYQHMCGYGNVT